MTQLPIRFQELVQVCACLSTYRVSWRKSVLLAWLLATALCTWPLLVLTDFSCRRAASEPGPVSEGIHVCFMYFTVR